MRQYIPLNKREKLLESPEPVLTFGARDEGRLQHQLDVATLQTLQIMKKRQTKLQKELRTASDRVDFRLKKIFSGENSDLLNETISQRVQPVEPDSRQKGSGVPVPRRSSHGRNLSLRKGEGEVSRKGKKVSALIESPSQLSATRRFSFPTPFEESNFSSAIRWAEVAFLETGVATLGPAVSAADPHRARLPHPLMVNVACYLLNEVLKRDSNLQGLWDLLRPTIFDSIYSPLRIVDEVPSGDGQECIGGGGEAATTVNSDNSEEGILAYPPRETTYETSRDFLNCRLWAQELMALQRKNNVPCKRVQELKFLLKESFFALRVMRRRAGTSCLQRIFSMWHRYTQRMHALRKSTLVFIAHNIRRRVEGQCFLRWRRTTLQSKLEKLNATLSDNRREARTNEQTHINVILQLRSQLSTVTDAKRLMQAAMEDQLLNVKESHKLAERALREVYKRSVKHAEQYKTHARRWERLAKTFRPTELCPRVPKTLLSLSISLADYEGELSRPYRVSAFRVDLARKELSKFLLCWVNTVMQASPQGKVWVPRERIVCTSRVRSDSTASGDTAVKSKSMNDTALLCFVRELRQLYDASCGVSKQCGSDFEGSFKSCNTLDGNNTVDELSTALEEAYQVLYAYTSEGLYPCLLMHCPRFFFQHRSGEVSGQNSSKSHQLDELMYTLSMLWLLAALFTGYVRYHCGVEAFLPSKHPASLRCANEKKLRQAVRQSLGVPHGASLVGPSRGSSSLPKALTKGSDAAGGGGGGSTPSMSSGRLSAGKMSASWSIGGGFASAAASTELLHAADFPPSGPSDFLSREGIVGDCLGTADTKSDIEVYTGHKGADLPPDGWEKDVDGILNDIVRSEEHEMRKRRRLRRKEEEEGEAVIQTTADGSLSGGGKGGANDASESQVPEILHSQGRSTSLARHTLTPSNLSANECNSRGVSLCAASLDYPDSPSSSRCTSEVGRKSVSEASTVSEDDLLDMEDERNTTLPAEGSKRCSNYLFGGPNDNLDTVRQLFLRKIPPPSSVFSVHIGKKSKKRFDNVVLLLQLPGERTETRRQERARKEGLHAFVERSLVDRERRQQWAGMARVVVSLVTRLRLLDINMKGKTAKGNSVERSNSTRSTLKGAMKTQSKCYSEACGSISLQTMMDSSASYNTTMPKTITQILPDGFTDTVHKTSLSNPKRQENKNSHTVGKWGLSRQVFGQSQGTRLSVGVSEPQERARMGNSAVAMAAKRGNGLLPNPNRNQAGCVCSAALGEKQREEHRKSLEVAPPLDCVGGLPPVSTRQSVCTSPPDSIATRAGAPAAYADANQSSLAQSSQRSFFSELPLGPLDPSITRPEFPYKGPKCKMLYRFNLRDNER